MKRLWLVSIMCAAVFLLIFNSFCEEEKKDTKQLPDKYFTEDYLYSISFLQGMTETIEAIESLDMAARKPAYMRYLELGNEYESKAESVKGKAKELSEQTALDEQRGDLLIAINCFEIVSRSSIFDLKDNAQRGVKKCRNKLVSLKSGDYEDQYLILQRCIDVDQDSNLKEREKKIRAYYERGKEYEDKANKEHNQKDFQAALDFYGMAASYTKDPELKKQANDARTRCVKILSNP